MITTNLSYDRPRTKPHELIAAIGGVFSIEETIGDTQPIHFRSLAELPPRTADEARALEWDSRLSDPEPNTTHEARIDDAIKAARDLFEVAEGFWPVAIWRWARGGYGFGHSIPEQTEVILYVDGALMAFEDGRAAR